MEIAAISFVCLALGLLVGYEWGERRGKRMRAVAEDFDHQNPINARSWEPVEVEGRTLYRLHP